jgi:hypothetical protein
MAAGMLDLSGTRAPRNVQETVFAGTSGDGWSGLFEAEATVVAAPVARTNGR